jgi:hypothetical protein
MNPKINRANLGLDKCDRKI